MKKLTFLSVLVLMMASCTRNNSNTPGDLSPIVTNGSWVVSLFSERGNDETSDFSGYSFVFQADGKLIVKKANAVVKEGTWSENSISNKFIIDLGIKDLSNKPLGELTDDWVIKSKSDVKVSLTDDNASSAEFLEFTKQ